MEGTVLLSLSIALARQEESSRLLEDKARRAEAEAKELEIQRQLAEEEKASILREAQEQHKENEAAVS